MKNNIILCINTSESEEIVISLYINSKTITHKRKIIKGNMSNDLLIFIDILLRQNKLDIQSIDAITVYCGPGSYTSLRIGINTANTLGWVLNVPVFCIKNKQQFKKEIKSLLQKILNKKKFTKPVDAYYQQEL